MIRNLLLAAVLLIFQACSTTIPVQNSETSAYEKQILDWHESRNDRLNQADGWLTLSGLFWLEQGENRIGGGNNNDLVFPGENIPNRLGSLYLTGDSVHFTAAPGVEITLNDSVVMEAGLSSDLSGEPDILAWGSLTWYVIQRGDRIGIRLKDTLNPNYVNFKPTELFPIDSNWRIPAHLEPFDTATTVGIINVLGDESPSTTPGILHFEINGTPQSLTPLGDPGDERYFIILGDATNGISTYGAGRFLVIPAVDENGQTVIDFNRSYNMPCVFSPYATCPLPPPENILDVAIEAGEKDYKLAGMH
ncbi:MAG: DUF1684 domain-containing protein [Candidatus Marinimicrobia bacterium]|nr:DUF1684 domain-containing protein [Candidatus Neomarinimicrobiota bacterium]